MSYIVGQVIRLKATFKNDSGQLIDPSGITLKIGSPDGKTATYTYGSGNDIVRLDTGIYIYDFDLAQDGEWKYAWHSTGIGASAAHNKFYVGPALL